MMMYVRFLLSRRNVGIWQDLSFYGSPANGRKVPNIAVSIKLACSAGTVRVQMDD
jgi:hypothetical protein